MIFAQYLDNHLKDFDETCSKVRQNEYKSDGLRYSGSCQLKSIKIDLNLWMIQCSSIQISGGHISSCLFSIGPFFRNDVIALVRKYYSDQLIDTYRRQGGCGLGKIFRFSLFSHNLYSCLVRYGGPGTSESKNIEQSPRNGSTKLARGTFLVILPLIWPN